MIIQVKWVCDVKGWAYEIISRRLIKMLGPEYQHHFVYIGGKSTDQAELNKQISRPADVIVCFSPRFLRFFPGRQNILLRLDGHRAFE